jgi:hypothetical protein
MADGGVYRVSGDPYRAFNHLHRRLFPRWDRALFVVDDTWFFVGASCDVPAWIPSRRATIRRRASGWSGSVHVRWEWEFGAWCARPVYRRHTSPLRSRVLRQRTRSMQQRPEIRQRTEIRPPVRSTHRVEIDPRIERKQVVKRVSRPSVDSTGRRATHRKQDVQRTRREVVERRRDR